MTDDIELIDDEPKPDYNDPWVQYTVLHEDCMNTSIADIVAASGGKIYIVDPYAEVFETDKDGNNKVLGIVTTASPCVVHQPNKQEWSVYVTQEWLDIYAGSQAILALALLPMFKAFVNHSMKDAAFNEISKFGDLSGLFKAHGVDQEAIKNAKVKMG